MRHATFAAVRLGYPGEMALQWTPLRLSMVSGNGVNSVPRPNYRTYRKMADAGVQYEPQEIELNGSGDAELEPAYVNRTVAEINTSAVIAELDQPSTPGNNSYHSLHQPLSLQSSTSSASSSGNGEERGEKRRTLNVSEESDVDAICVQQSAVDELPPPVRLEKNTEKTEPDGSAIPEKEESSCGLDCLYFTMQCCECTIL